MLEVALAHDPIARACRVSAKLKILLEELLSGSTDAKIRPVAVEHVVTVERDAAISSAGTLVTHGAAIAAASATPTGPISAMAATTHTFNIHYYDESLSCSQPGHARASRGSRRQSGCTLRTWFPQTGFRATALGTYRGLLQVNRHKVSCTTQVSR
jgi:hypothetical protein